MFSERTFKQLRAEPSESVSVGDHNFFDKSALDGVQKREQALPLEVEPACDVLVDMGNVVAMRLDLPTKVARFSLFGSRDTRVGDNPLFRLGIETEAFGEVASVVAMRRLFVGPESDAPDFALLSPEGQGGSGDAIPANLVLLEERGTLFS